jgi:hypothetical protein
MVLPLLKRVRNESENLSMLATHLPIRDFCTTPLRWFKILLPFCGDPKNQKAEFSDAI